MTTAATPAIGRPPSGKLRRLQRISDTDGFIRVAAIDHPENYLALFDPDLDHGRRSPRSSSPSSS